MMFTNDDILWAEVSESLIFRNKMSDLKFFF